MTQCNIAYIAAIEACASLTGPGLEMCIATAEHSKQICEANCAVDTDCP